MRFLQERDGDGVRAGFDGYLQFDALGELFGRGGGIRVAQVRILLAADGDQFDAGAVERDFDVAGELQAADGVDGVGPEADLKHDTRHRAGNCI